MVDERESPSAGWREVYAEMEADPNAEEATHRCPDCGRRCENVLRDVYECPEHGVFRASASDGQRDRSGADDDNRGRTDAENETRDVPDAEDASDENREADRQARGPAD